MNGSFDFESESKAGSRKNATDARVKMLELFGNEAVSWVIDHVEAAPVTDPANDYVQPALDFREPVAPTRKRKTVDRGKL